MENMLSLYMDGSTENEWGTVDREMIWTAQLSKGQHSTA